MNRTRARDKLVPWGHLQVSMLLRLCKSPPEKKKKQFLGSRFWLFSSSSSSSPLAPFVGMDVRDIDMAMIPPLLLPLPYMHTRVSRVSFFLLQSIVTCVRATQQYMPMHFGRFLFDGIRRKKKRGG